MRVGVIFSCRPDAKGSVCCKHPCVTSTVLVWLMTNDPEERVKVAMSKFELTEFVDDRYKKMDERLSVRP
jgi:hypothetical protein